MALANYTDLLASVSNWLHRDDITAIIPDWVTLCETTINCGDGDQLDGLRTAAQETTSNITCTAGLATIPLPADWVETRRVYITFSGVRRELVGRAVSPMSQTQTTAVQNIPETYFISGSTMVLDPIPYQPFVITLLYYAKIGSLAVSSTNWLMTQAPMVYLFGTIAHGAPWLGPKFDPTPWMRGFRVGMAQVADSDSSRFDMTRLRSEAAAMLGGSAYPYSSFLSGV